MRLTYRVVGVALLVTLFCIVGARAASPSANMSSPGPVPIGAFTSALYDYALKMVGLAIFVMFLIAGLTYMIPALQKALGNPIQIMQDAVIGLVILVSAYVVLNSIHPNLVNIGATESTGLGGNVSGVNYREGEGGRDFGQSCANTASCRPGGVCTNGTCAVAPDNSLSAGQSCNGTRQCAAGLICSGPESSRKCSSASGSLGVGDSCTTSQQCRAGLQCIRSGLAPNPVFCSDGPRDGDTVVP